jgi:predicted RecA/RadA family phage recombinase
MKNSVLGGDTIQFVLAANCLAGDIINVGAAMSGVAQNSGSIGDTIAVKLRGVFTLPKTTSLVITIGDEVYFNTGTGKVTKTKTDKCLGVAWASALTNDTTIQVLLVPKRGEQNAAESQTAYISPIKPTSNTSAIAGSFADLPAARTAVNTLQTEVEARLDAIETKIDALTAALIASGQMAAS